MIRTGLYGGSFNPIHEGHVSLSRALLCSGLVDEMWLLVSPQNPFKANDELLADSARLELARIAASHVEGLHVSDYEFHLPRPSYMVHTLEGLRYDFPGHEFVLVIGADNWERFPRWYRHEDILARHRIIVYPRSGYALRDLPSTVTVAKTPLYDISSTDIRRRMGLPGYDGRGLPAGVWEAIQKKGYYGLSPELGSIVHQSLEGGGNAPPFRL